jgi:hypothetical protein
MANASCFSIGFLGLKKEAAGNSGFFKVDAGLAQPDLVSPSF